jgi:hypothetical protein
MPRLQGIANDDLRVRSYDLLVIFSAHPRLLRSCPRDMLLLLLVYVHRTAARTGR